MIEFTRIEHASKTSAGGLVTKVSFTNKPTVTSHHDEGGDMTPLNGIGGEIEGATTTMGGVISDIEGKIQDALGKQNRFVFPVSTSRSRLGEQADMVQGNGSFDMSNPQLNANGDLLVEINYVPPEPVRENESPANETPAKKTPEKRPHASKHAA
jgi:hypothetical protein